MTGVGVSGILELSGAESGIVLDRREEMAIVLSQMKTLLEALC